MMLQSMQYGDILPGDMLIEHGWRRKDYKRTTVAWLVISVVRYSTPKKKRPRDTKARLKDRRVKFMLMRMWTDDESWPVFSPRDYDLGARVSLDSEVIRDNADANASFEQLYA